MAGFGLSSALERERDCVYRHDRRATTYKARALRSCLLLLVRVGAYTAVHMRAVLHGARFENHLQRSR